MSAHPARVVAVVALTLAVTSELAFAHGGVYLPPPRPKPGRLSGGPGGGVPGGGGGATTGGGDALTPIATTPSDEQPTVATAEHWSRWWFTASHRYLVRSARAVKAAATPDARSAAAGADALAVLRGLTEDPNEDIASAALVALGSHPGDDPDAPAFLRALMNRSAHQSVREAGAVSLGLGHAGKDVAAHLLQVAGGDAEDSRLRAIAVYALGLRRLTEASEPLYELAADPATPPDVRCAAASSLGMLGDESSVARLRTLALARTPADDAAVRVRAHAVHGLGCASLGDAETLSVLRALASDPSIPVRKQALLALGSKAAQDDEAALRILSGALARDPDDGVRAAAALGLGAQAHARARKALEASWKSDADRRPFVAFGLALAARRIADPSLTELLRIIPATKADDDLKGACLLALGVAHDPAGVEAARRIASGLYRTPLRAHAVTALALLDDVDGGIPILRDILQDPLASPLLHREAAAALGVLGDTESAALLDAALLTSKSSYVRGEAAVALGRIGGARALHVLTNTLSDPSQPGLTRAMAAVGLGVLLGRVDDRGPWLVAWNLDWARTTPAAEELLTIL